MSLSNNDIFKSLNITQLRNQGINGSDIKIAVIDTGINNIKDELTVSGGYNCITNTSTDYIDDDGHGTEVASIIASKTLGIAPNCKLFAVKADISSSRIQDIINQVVLGIKWCIKEGIDIINMSFGFSGYSSKELEEACKQANEAGSIIVCAAGNNSLNAYLTIPARYNSTLAISNIKKDNIISQTSSYSKGIDFCCYGTDIAAYNNDSNIISVSGTSFSSAVATGIIALIKQQNNNLSFREIYEILKDNCLDLGDKGKDIYYGFGLIKGFIVPAIYKNENQLIIEDLSKNIYFKNICLKVSVGSSIDSDLRFIPDGEIYYTDYQISDSDIAIVNDEGIITGKKVGSTTLIAITNNKVAVCLVEVTELVIEEPEIIIPVKNLFNFNDLNIYQLHKAGIKGKGIKIAYIGYGCIQGCNLLNIYKHISVTTETDLRDVNGYGTIHVSLIAGNEVGIAPEAEIYVIQSAINIGSISYTNAKKAIQWCINNKMDIINFDTSVKSSEAEALLKSCYDNNIICVSNAAGWSLGPSHTSKYSLTVSYVTDEKNFIANDSNKTPYSGEFIDCVGYGYGVTCINNNGEYEIYELGKNPHKIYLCNIAVMQVMGMIALIKQQNPNINNAVKVRSLLSRICEPLYGGKNNNTGYGLFKAALLSELNLPDNLFD